MTNIPTLKQRQRRGIMNGLNAIMTPSTLAVMVGDLSIYLTEQYDEISAGEWDDVQDDAQRIINTLVTLVGSDGAMTMIMAAKADPTHIF